MATVHKFPVQRWPASTDPELNVLEFLEALVADIKRGKFNPQGVLLALVEIDPRIGAPINPPPYLAINLSPLEAAGLAARLAKVLT